jgi:ParB-like chromosome segregation protein Spo0J
MEFHEIAAIFPMMSDAALNDLASDIRANGLREAVWTHDGKIIDGRNRYRACGIAGVTPHYQEWNGQGSLTAFVVSLNLHRRHLTESQRGLVAAKLATMQQGARTDIASIEAMSQPEAAELLNVGRPTVQRAAKVL